MRLTQDPAPKAIRLIAEARQLRMLTRRNIAQSRERRAQVRRVHKDFAKLIVRLPSGTRALTRSAKRRRLLRASVLL